MVAFIVLCSVPGVGLNKYLFDSTKGKRLGLPQVCSEGMENKGNMSLKKYPQSETKACGKIDFYPLKAMNIHELPSKAAFKI